MISPDGHLLPRDITLQRIKSFLFPRLDHIDSKIQKTLYRQATPALFVLMSVILLVSFFIFVISALSNLDLILLTKSLFVFIPYFLLVGVLHRTLQHEKKDYYLLLVTIFFVATWGIVKDIVNFDIVYTRYGILYVTILFFGLIFMPFRPVTSLILGVYCAFLYGLLWLIFVFKIFGYEWFIPLGEQSGISWVKDHLYFILSELRPISHGRLHSTWYSFQYLLFGGVAFVFRAASLHSFIKTFITQQKLLSTEGNLILNTDAESQYVEFKASARWDIAKTHVNKELERVIAKTIAGFMNAEGGTLLIGVNDDGIPVGLEHDYKTLKKRNADGYELFLIGLISRYLGKEYCRNVEISFFNPDKFPDKEVCIIRVEPSDTPIFIEQLDQALFVRTGNNTQKLNTREAIDYIKTRFGEKM